jgi:hypothetical protein
VVVEDPQHWRVVKAEEGVALSSRLAEARAEEVEGHCSLMAQEGPVLLTREVMEVEVGQNLCGNHRHSDLESF